MTDDDVRGPEAHAEVSARDIARLIAAIADRDGRLIAHEISALHPADAADALEQLAPEQFEHALRLAPLAFVGEVLVELDDALRDAALAALPLARIAEAVASLDSDDAASLVQNLPAERRDSVLEAVSTRDRRALEESLAFDEDTAGRLAQREFVAAPEFWTLGEIIDRLRATAVGELPDTFFEVYIVDPAFRPVGAVPLSDFVKHPRTTKLADIARPPHALIRPEMDQEDVAYAFSKYHLAQAPVVDEAGRLTGMITVDDMVEVIREETDEDLLALAGVSDGGVAATALSHVRARAPWLLLNTGTAILASIVFSLFGATIEKVVALAILMPIVASLGGNAGTQALAVAVRALAARELTPANAARMVAREGAAALVNGVLFALLLAVVAIVWFGQPAIGAVIAVAMLINFVCAGLVGILVPLTLKRLGADPAVSSSVFVTFATDAVGFFVFLGLATAVLA